MTYKGVTPTWAWLEEELDFGDVPVQDKSFHIVNPDVGPQSNWQ